MVIIPRLTFKNTEKNMMWINQQEQENSSEKIPPKLVNLRFSVNT